MGHAGKASTERVLIVFFSVVCVKVEREREREKEIVKNCDKEREKKERGSVGQVQRLHYYYTQFAE